MFSSSQQGHSLVRDFRIDEMMRYSLFVPRLHNLCLSLGFEPGNIMPSCAFCSDENQGFPIILITKHFGAFPFNHGRVGGVVATDRHGPHADHGKDMVIIQASHVGYDAVSESFGRYCRLQTSDNSYTTTCGKIGGVTGWYLEEYQFAQENVYLARDADIHTITIDNQLLDEQRAEGLFLDLDKMLSTRDGKWELIQSLSTSRVYAASEDLRRSFSEDAWPTTARAKIGERLGPDWFSFRRVLNSAPEGQDHLENNLLDAMPWIVSSPAPLLVAAQVNTQVEFDRTFRTIVRAPEYRGRKLLFIACLNIDISPRKGQLFPLTKCVPWAAYIQDGGSGRRTVEQSELIELLMRQDTENPLQVDMEAAIGQMVHAPEVRIKA